MKTVSCCYRESEEICGSTLVSSSSESIANLCTEWLINPKVLANRNYWFNNNVLLAVKLCAISAMNDEIPKVL